MKSMEKIYLSDAGPKVSPAIYGFWRWSQYKDCGPELMETVVHYCLEHGINTFDHADIYGHYDCERLFGDLLRSGKIARKSVVLFSTCGIKMPSFTHPEYRVLHYDTSARHIITSVEQSLRNLGTDHLDVFFLNQLDPLSNLEETALALERLRSDGKILNIGVKNFTVFQHQLLASMLRIPIVTHQMELSLLHTDPLINGQFDYTKQRYMRPLAAAPLAGGRIENGIDPKAVRVRDKLTQLADRYRSNIESVAVAWIIKTGAFPLIGTSDLNRIANIIGAFQIDLDHQDWYDLLHTATQTHESAEY